MRASPVFEKSNAGISRILKIECVDSPPLGDSHGSQRASPNHVAVETKCIHCYVVLFFPPSYDAIRQINHVRVLRRIPKHTAKV